RHVRSDDLKDVALQLTPADAEAAPDAARLHAGAALAAPNPEIVREDGEVVGGQVFQFVRRRVVEHAAQENFGGGVGLAIGLEGGPALRGGGDKLVGGLSKLGARCGV